MVTPADHAFYHDPNVCACGQRKECDHSCMPDVIDGFCSHCGERLPTGADSCRCRVGNFVEKLCSVERDRMTAAEICIDELLTIMDRHNEQGSPNYSKLKGLSASLNKILREADGMEARYERLIRVRQALTAAFPMTDEDLEGPPSHKESADPEGT